jgi:tetratricopeptide (TPR) repeat protein
MAKDKLTDRITDLFQRGEWTEAQKFLNKERKKDQGNHWILTQLGVTFYEQQRYEEALPLFVASLEIVPDCPLTLWNLAGTLDALGKTAQAISIYTWLLESTKSPEVDPCWESTEWAEALKADCVYRLGVCFQHLDAKQKAEDCYREYLNLLLSGIKGSYSSEDVMRQIRALHNRGKQNGTASALRKGVHATLLASGIEPRKGRRGKPPKIDVGDLPIGRHAAARE